MCWCLDAAYLLSSCWKYHQHTVGKYNSQGRMHTRSSIKNFFGHSRKEDNLLPKPCKTKDSLQPQHAINWEIICTNWEEHLLIGKSIQRDMLNKASRQDARPIKLDPKFLIQEVVGKNCGHLGSSPFYARCMADLRSGLEHPK